MQLIAAANGVVHSTTYRLVKNHHAYLFGKFIQPHATSVNRFGELRGLRKRNGLRRLAIVCYWRRGRTVGGTAAKPPAQPKPKLAINSARISTFQSAW